MKNYFKRYLGEQLISKRFIHNKSGTTMIEMALLMPILMLMSVGTIELGLILLTNVIVEGATQTAARTAKTGANGADPNQSREDFIKSEVLRLSVGLLDADKLEFSVNTYGSATPSAGAGGDLVAITVSYDWDLFTPLVGEFIQNPYEISSQATFRNEPF